MGTQDKFIILAIVKGAIPLYESRGFPSAFWGTASIYDSRTGAQRSLRRLSSAAVHSNIFWVHFKVVERRKGLQLAAEALMAAAARICIRLDEEMGAESYEDKHRAGSEDSRGRD